MWCLFNHALWAWNIFLYCLSCQSVFSGVRESMVTCRETKGDSRRMDCFSKQIQSFTCHRMCVGILNNSLHTEDFYGSCLATDKKLPVLDIVRAMSCTVVMIKHALSLVVMGWFWSVMLWWCSWCTLRVMQPFQIMTEGGFWYFWQAVEVRLLPGQTFWHQLVYGNV